MVGIPSFKNAATIGYVVRAAQAGLVQYFPDLHPVLVNSDAGSPDGTQRVVVETEPPDYVEQILLVRPTNRLDRVSLTYPEIDGVGGKGAALRTIFEIAAALEVQALVVVDSDLRSIVPEWIELLAGPILKGGYDFVAPLYARYKYDGTITNTVTYPLTRALYGHRIRQPIGGDFGVSGDLVRHYLALDDWTPDISKFGIDIWMTTSAPSPAASPSARRAWAPRSTTRRTRARTSARCSARSWARSCAWRPAHADHWLSIHGSHDVPGLRLRADHRSAAARGEHAPPPVRVPCRLADARRHVATDAGAGDRGEVLAGLAAEAGSLADRAGAIGLGGDGHRPRRRRWRWPRPPARSTSRTTCGPASSTTWSSRRGRSGRDHRVETSSRRWSRSTSGASAASSSRTGVTTEQAEERVERQAREFELLKPYLIERWRDAGRAPGEAGRRRCGRPAGRRSPRASSSRSRTRSRPRS